MDMRVKISKEKCDHLSGNKLLWALIKSPILQVKGQSMQKKKAVYEELTPGQKSLFSFWVMYGHIQSGWLSFYLGRYAQFLPMIGKGLEQVNDVAMLDNLHAAERLYRKNEKFLLSTRDTMEKGEDLNSEAQIDFDKVKLEFAQIDNTLFTLLEKSIQILESYFRAKPEEFVIYMS